LILNSKWNNSKIIAPKVKNLALVQVKRQPQLVLVVPNHQNPKLSQTRVANQKDQRVQRRTKKTLMGPKMKP
jgi:hypothetical protein